MAKKIKLLRCPFCGGKVEFVDYGIKDCDEPFEDWDIECQKCHILCVVPAKEEGAVTTKEEAARGWNKRVKPLTSYDGCKELEDL